MRKFVILLLLFCAGISGCTGQEKEISWEQVTGETASDESEEALKGQRESAFEGKETAAETQISVIYVDVTGAVNHPGVVKLPSGARVYQAIEQAGGMRQDAAAELVNQAAVLADGQQIRVYTQEEAQEPVISNQVGIQNGAAGGTADGSGYAQGKININEATAEELMTLPGIGEAKAADIIRYREENGGFSAIEEIMEISGIKEAVFGKIKDKIAVTQ